MDKTKFRRKLYNMLKNVDVDDLTDEDIYTSLDEVMTALGQGEMHAGKYIKQLEDSEKTGTKEAK